MATCTTRAFLEAQALRLNQLTGSPTQRFKPRDETEQGPIRFNIGHYHIDGSNGGYSLVRIANESGGEHTVIERRSAGELADLIRAYTNGIAAGLPAAETCRRIAAFSPDDAESDDAEADALYAIKADAVKALHELAGSAA